MAALSWGRVVLRMGCGDLGAVSRLEEDLCWNLEAWLQDVVFYGIGYKTQRVQIPNYSGLRPQKP